MALTLQFPEEGEYQSRAWDLEDLDVDNTDPPSALFHWSKSARETLQSQVLSVETLIIDMTGSNHNFTKAYTSEWTIIGSILLSDEPIVPCNLAPNDFATCYLMSKAQLTSRAKADYIVLVLPQAPSEKSVWPFLETLRSHIHARDTVCLTSHLHTIYDSQDLVYSRGEMDSDTPVICQLCTSSSSNSDLKAIPFMPSPQFLMGLPAALLTEGELRKTSVHVLISMRRPNTLHVDTLRSFSQIANAIGLDPNKEISYSSLETKFNALYT